MKTIILATRNQHKIAEIQAILPHHVHWRTLREFPLAPEAVEDAATFRGNAEKKAATLARHVRPLSPVSDDIYVLADDSGLEVDALDGAPGVLSARFANLDTGLPGNSPDAANNTKLLRLLANLPETRRTARFRCVLALLPLAPAMGGSDLFESIFFEGVCEGRILTSADGEAGFGYDPLFVPLGHSKSFARLGDDIKNSISHRAQALRHLRNWMDETWFDDPLTPSRQRD